MLLDLMMPVVDGVTFLQILNEQRTAALPGIVVSAVCGDREVPGAARLVKKPVAPSVLVDVVRDCCGPP